MQPDDSAIILYTSGTTASPKGCVYIHRGMATQSFNYGAALELTPADRFWTPLPLFHVAGLVTFLATSRRGARSSTSAATSIPDAALEHARARALHARLPGLRDDLARRAERARASRTADLSALRLVIAVGSPGTLRIMQERLPSVPQVSSFGSTECGGFVSIGRPTDPLEARA